MALIRLTGGFPAVFYAFAAFLSAFTQPLFAQTYPLTGSVSDGNAAPVEAATVSLLRSADSSLVKVELTGTEGKFEFADIKPGAYRIGVTALGFQKYVGAEVKLTDQGVQCPGIRLSEGTVNLKEVTVAADKPFIERRNDRLIVNVENSILASGSSAMEILERAPGVRIDQNDNILLKGRSGVNVMIDGKPNPMSAQDLANYLRALPSNSIERIEIISNPSAKYDAAGNAGIIDIRMKKDKNLGTNGSYNANYGQGVYPKAGAGISVNHREKKFNVFASYNYSFRKGMNDLNLYREFFDNGVRTGAYRQRYYLTIPFNLNVLRTGVDYTLSPKTTIGFVASGTINHFKPTGENVSEVQDGAGQKLSGFNTTNRSTDVWPNYGFNGNFKHSFKPNGQDLTVDLDYARYWNTTTQNFTTRYFDLEGIENKPAYLLSGDPRGNLQIRSAKADYTQPLGEKTKLETGVKSSIVDADNNLQYFDKSDANHPVFDSTNSNHFIYRENINAAYLNFSKEWTKFSLQAGLRVENTIAEGKQLINGQSFSRNYTNWFPSAFLTYKFSENYEMGLNMSRRLDRPTYQQLNPFKFFLDPTTYKEGNPYLNPQFTWSFEWNHTLFQRYNLTLSYALTTDNITEVIGPAAGLNRITVQTNENLSKVDYLNLSLSIPFNVGKWWSSTNNLSSYYGRYRGNYAFTNLNNGNLVFEWSNNNTFKLGKEWSAELNFMYHTREIYGFMNLNPQWGLGMGVQKQLLDKRLTLKLALTDIFWTNLPSAVINYRDYRETFRVFRDTRTATISATYRFGNNQMSPVKKRAGGAVEEKRRAGGE